MSVEELVAVTVDLLDDLGPDAPPDAVGVAVPAFVDEGGVVKHSVTVPALEGDRFVSMLAHELTSMGPEPDVFPIVDVSAASLGEFRLGSGRNTSRFMCVAIGTGINMGLVLDGRPFTPTYGCIGDAGHFQVGIGARSCICGGSGCLETIVSGRGLGESAAELGLASVRELGEAARRGHGGASEVIRQAGTALGRAIVSWAVLFWPQRIALVGGVSLLGDLLLEPAREEIVRTGTPYVVGALDLVQGELGRSATVAGAGLWALHRVGEPERAT